LIGYVQQIPAHADEKTLVAEPSDPPPPELVSALERVLANIPEIASYKLERTFNPERDREPHLTLTLRSGNTVSREPIAERIMGEIADALPPPGYIDILFEES
jgi:hypothetical protein